MAAGKGNTAMVKVLSTTGKCERGDLSNRASAAAEATGTDRDSRAS